MMLLILVKFSLSLATIWCFLLDAQLVQGGPTTSKPHPVEHQEVKDNPTGSNDMWSMVATMRENSKSTAQDHTIAPIKGVKFDWNINLDQHGRYQLNWRVNYPKNKISFALEINTSKSNFSYGNDIFALGFSERGELSSSDYCLVWFDLSHRIHLQDARTDSSNLLELIDSSKSVCKLIRGRQLEGGRESTDKDKDEEDSEDFADSDGQRVADLNELDRKELVAKRLPAHAGIDDVINEVLFKRPLEVCDDSQGYYTIDNGTTHMVWFTLKGPVLSLDGLNLTELRRQSASSNGAHAGGKGLNFESGLRRAQLVATKPYSGSPSKTSSTTSSGLDIRMDKYEVPSAETTYWCRLFKLPERFESRRYHITQYEAVIEPGNEHVVHHMELFNCATTTTEQRHQLDQLYNSQGGWSGHCSSSSRPPATEPCRRVILAWAMGAKPLVYPEQVGQSIGGRDYSPYVVLEVHYNNVERSKGLVDSSGLRFHYTPELRPFDAGVLEIGLEYTDKNSIPPNMVAPLAGYCVSECTRAAMSGGGGSLFSMANNLDYHHTDSTDTIDKLLEPDSWHNQHNRHRNGRHRGSRQHQSQMSSFMDMQKNMKGAEASGGIHIFAAQMHTHLTGVASWTEHVRGGRVLGELQRDDHYSPHFQEIRLLPKPIHIEPGDALVHYCLYDTRSRSNITLGGYATTDEMCVSYLHYYPKIDLEVCKSSVDSQALEEYFASLARDELQNTSEKLDLSLWEHSAGDGNEDEHEHDEGADEGDVDDKFRTKTNDTKRRRRRRGSVSLNYHSINWSPRRARELIEFYSTAPLSVQCNRSDGSRWPGNWNGIEPTRLVKWPEQRTKWEEPVLGDESQVSVAPPNLDFFGHPSARDLVAYRGLGHKRKHAQCRRRHRGAHQREATA